MKSLCDVARRESGSILPLLGALIFVAFAVIALATEVALMHGQFLEVAATADAAAEAGASMLDHGAAHAGRVELAPAAARSAAERHVTRSAPADHATIRATPAEICVVVERVHRLAVLSMVGTATQRISVESCASPAAG